jgi:hypothetical protein
MPLYFILAVRTPGLPIFGWIGVFICANAAGPVLK